MQIEKRENRITLVPDSDYERFALEDLRNHSIKKMEWED